MVVDAVTQSIRDEWAAKDAHYAAHPVATPKAQDGTVLTLGQRVRSTCSMEPEGVITELAIRCYGDPRTEDVFDYSKGIGWDKRVKIGEEPSQQVWVFINGRNCVHRPEQIIEVLS